MALGVITKPSGVQADTVFGNKKIRIREVILTGGANYTTGGESITPSMVGLSKRIEQVLTDGGAKNAAGTLMIPVRFDYSAGKLQIFRYDGASAGKASLEEAAANFDASLFTARITFIGV